MMRKLWKIFCKCFPTVILFGTPLVFSPLITSDSSAASKCGYVVLVMSIYWATEVIPLAITALLPVVMLPILGLATTEQACIPYLKSTNMLFLGCLALALAVEKSRLHQRIALKVLLSIGNKFQFIVLGFMLTTMFLSMWIVSTAAVAMMLPIADAILAQVFPGMTPTDDCNNSKDEVNSKTPMINGNDNGSGNHQSGFNLDAKRKDRLSKILYLSIAYSATIGGVSTLTSNGPNMVMKFVLEEIFDGRDRVDYASWFIFAAPFSIIATIACWITYNFLFMRNVSVPKEKRYALKHVITKKYEELGAMTFHELAVLGVFVFMIVLYMTHDPQFMTGWSKWFLTLSNNIKPKPATAAIFSVVLLFVIPSRPFGPFPSPGLIDWRTIQTKLAWGVLILRGGGFSMADAVTSSGLSKLIGHQLAHLNFLPTTCLVLVLSVFSIIIIEFMRTSATATIVLPVAIQLARDLNINPLVLVIPITIACAYAFVLPVGTTANAIVYDHANLKITDMLIPGIIAKVICFALMFANVYLLGYPIFGLSDHHPEWMFAESKLNSAIGGVLTTTEATIADVNITQRVSM